jgi:hypothetical protein
MGVSSPVTFTATKAETNPSGLRSQVTMSSRGVAFGCQPILSVSAWPIVASLNFAAITFTANCSTMLPRWSESAPISIGTNCPI